MPESYSKDFIVKLADFSAGASSPDFTRHWIHSLYRVSETGFTTIAGSTQDARGHTYQIVMYRHAGTGDPESVEFPDQRLLCHVLLSEIPGRGVAEALASLAGIWEFYSEAPTNMPLLASTASARPRRGRIAERRDMDPIVVGEL